MDKNFIFFITLFVLNSCASTPDFSVHEEMLPNGHWVFGVLTENSCMDLVMEDKKITYKEIGKMKYTHYQKTCIDVFKKSLVGRSVELCGHENYSLYGCLNSENKSESSQLKLGSTIRSNFKLKCYLKCDPK